jgi:hypothetical protein
VGVTEHEETRPAEPPAEAEAPETPEPEQPAAEPEQPAPEPEQPGVEEARPTDPAPEEEAPPAAEAAPTAQTPTVTPDTEQPRVGPKIVGMAEEKPPPIAVIKRLQDPRRPRRKRPNAAEKHRRAFFARLSELRGSRPSPPKQEAPTAEAPAAEAAPDVTDVEAVEAALPVEAGQELEPATPAAEQPEAPAEEAGAAEDAPSEETPAEEHAPAAEEAPAEDAAPPVEEPAEPIAEETPARRQARLAAAIERVGGAETVRQALQPKRDDDGQPKKWAVVCCDASMGLKPGDPTFNAWVRLAATPVREIKGVVRPEDDGRRGGRRGGGGPGRGRRREGGEGAPRRDDRGGRGPRRERVSREDLQGAQDGTFKPTIRIIGLEAQDEDRKERERRRKEEREAKRKAERERLERLGY